MISFILKKHCFVFWLPLPNKSVSCSLETTFGISKWEKCLKGLVLMLLSRYPEKARYPSGLLKSFRVVLARIFLTFFAWKAVFSLLLILDPVSKLICMKLGIVES